MQKLLKKNSLQFRFDESHRYKTAKIKNLSANYKHRA